MSDPIDPVITPVGDPMAPPPGAKVPLTRIRRIPSRPDPLQANRRRDDEARKSWGYLSWIDDQPGARLSVHEGGWVYEQRSEEDTCAAIAVAAAMRATFGIYKSRAKDEQVQAKGAPLDTKRPLNPYFLHGLAREALFQTEDPRSRLLNTLAVANRYGTPVGLEEPTLEEVLAGPYSKRVSPEVLQAARPQTLKGHADLGTYLGDWYTWLAHQGPVIVLLVTKRDAFAAVDARNPVVPFPPREEIRIESDTFTDEYAGHCAVLMGYDPQRGFLLMNSYGVGWGDRGYAFIDVDTAKRSFLAGYGLVVGEQMRRSAPQRRADRC